MNYIKWMHVKSNAFCLHFFLFAANLNFDLISWKLFAVPALYRVSFVFGWRVKWPKLNTTPFASNPSHSRLTLRADVVALERQLKLGQTSSSDISNLLSIIQKTVKKPRMVRYVLPIVWSSVGAVSRWPPTRKTWRSWGIWMGKFWESQRNSVIVRGVLLCIV